MQTWIYILLLIFLIGLVAQSNQKIWHLQNTQKSFSRLMVDQLKTTVDSIDEIQKKLAKQNDVLVIQPSVIRDSWTYAPQWISFVQNSSLLVLQKTQELYKSNIDLVDNDLTTILTKEISSDERISLALRWSQKEDTVQRNAIVDAIRKAADFGSVKSESKAADFGSVKSESKSADFGSVKSESKASDFGESNAAAPTVVSVDSIQNDFPPVDSIPVSNETEVPVVIPSIHNNSNSEDIVTDSVQDAGAQEVAVKEEPKKKAPKRKGRNSTKESSESSLNL